VSLSRHVDVWCDHPDCGQWYGDGERTAHETRAAARRKGWVRRPDTTGQHNGEQYDLCPKHANWKPEMTP
jgi:hypothetical protein